MPEQPIMLKVLLGQRHWQNYATFCAEYDKAARKLDADLKQTYPSRAQLHRWLSGSLRSLPYADHCRVLEEMFPGWTAEQMFQATTPELLYAGGQPGGSSITRPAGGPGPQVFAAPSVGIRPFVEQAFAREHVCVDFAGFSGETLHGVIQEPLDKIRIGRIRPASLSIRMLLPDTTRPMVLPCRADDLTDDADYRDRVTRLTARHAQAILDSVQELTRLGLLESGTAEIRIASLLAAVQAVHPQRRGSVLRPVPDRQAAHTATGRRARHLRPDGKGRRGVPPLSAQRPAHRHPPHPAGPGLVRLNVGHHQLRVPRMTAGSAPGEAADALLARTRYVLLDFDGPVCDIFAGLPDTIVAGRLRKLITGQDVQIPDEIARTPDPIEVFTYSATISTALAAMVETEMTGQELAAVATARPTPYVHDVVTSCRDTRRLVAVVSNNAERAVRSYLALHGLDDRIELIAARTSPDPAQLKPSPHFIEQAITGLRASPAECVLIGDSTTDIQAANRAGIASIGYANRPGRQMSLTTAGATAVVTSLADLVLPLRARPLPN